MVVSEVTARKEEVKVGTSLWYIDSCNCAKWNVTEVNEDYFVAVEEDGYEEMHEFVCLQYGWKF